MGRRTDNAILFFFPMIAIEPHDGASVTSATSYPSNGDSMALVRGIRSNVFAIAARHVIDICFRVMY